VDDGWTLEWEAVGEGVVMTWTLMCDSSSIVFDLTREPLGPEILDWKDTEAENSLDLIPKANEIDILIEPSHV
jgi:hypothetical protein